MSKALHNSLLPERQALRDGSNLRIVTSKEEGTDIQHLPAGVYGFTGAPAAAEIPLFIKPYFEFHWQDEYGVFSFGEKNLSAIVKYIQNQKQHHADGKLIAAMEQMNER